MRIRRLALRNYRRHQATEVEFPDGVFALLGRNGAGKSTLLEAISFALFGPAAVRTAKDLLRSDNAPPADAVRVELDFELGGQALRIVRELRGKALAPSASMEADGVALVAPGAGSSEAATREVERRLGMDRDAFHTTVVAQQGELSRLADARPADRKRLLLRMLGIDRVERAIEEARQRRNGATVALERLRAALPDLAALEVEATGISARRVAAQAAVVAAEAEVAQALREEGEARKAAEAEEQVAEAAKAHAFRLAAARQEEAHCREATLALQPEVAEAESALRKAEALEPLAGLVASREEELRAATVADAARGQHAARLQYVVTQRAALQKAQAELQALAEPVDEAPILAASQASLATVEASLQERSNELAVLESQLLRIQARREELGRLGPAAPCPTCERPLNGTFEHLHRSVEGESEGLLLRRQAAVQELERLRAEGQAARGEVQLVLRRNLESQRLALRRAELARRVADETQRLAHLEATLGPEPPAAPELPRLRALALEARKAREEQVRLKAEAARLPLLVPRLAQATSAFVAASAARESLEQAHIPVDEVRLGQLRLASDQATARHQARQQQLHACRLAAEKSQAEEAAAAQRLQDGRVLANQATALEEEVRLWTAVVGRAGGGLLDRFRDHLVGRVGPAISAEASRLLARFTGGRYTEVLLDDEHEVFVSDQGVPYALDRFSGGESDLVHLALRLAVSRLLAERGGAELRFLALDEVFGSLDRERRESVAAALQELGTLYSQVLVVSHLEGLQESLGQVLRVTEDDGQASLAWA